MTRTADPTQHDRGQHVCMRVERGGRAVDECTSSPLHTLTLIYVYSAWRVSEVGAVAWEKESNRFNFSSGPPASSHSPETCRLGRVDLVALTWPQLWTWVQRVFLSLYASLARSWRPVQGVAPLLAWRLPVWVNVWGDIFNHNGEHVTCYLPMTFEKAAMCIFRTLGVGVWTQWLLFPEGSQQRRHNTFFLDSLGH